jgi:hypothetical protein
MKTGLALTRHSLAPATKIRRFRISDFGFWTKAPSKIKNRKSKIALRIRPGTLSATARWLRLLLEIAY